MLCDRQFFRHRCPTLLSSSGPVIVTAPAAYWHGFACVTLAIAQQVTPSAPPSLFDAIAPVVSAVRQLALTARFRPLSCSAQQMPCGVPAAFFPGNR